MKRCPTCQRTFADEALKFCRHDGAPLVGDSPPFDAESRETLLKLSPPGGEQTTGAAFPHGAARAGAGERDVWGTPGLPGVDRPPFPVGLLDGPGPVCPFSGAA